MLGKKSQIWVETVIYTLIGLAIIGLLLSIVKPAIDRKKDQILIEQSLTVLENIDNRIEDVRYYGVGNSRTIDVKLKKGKLEVNCKEDYVKFSIESAHMYSEVDEEIISPNGRIKTLTEKTGKKYDVALTLNYKGNLDLTWDREEKIQNFQAAPTTYTISITNRGMIEGEDLIQIDFS